MVNINELEAMQKPPKLFRQVNVAIPEYFNIYEVDTVIKFKNDGVRNYFLIKRHKEFREFLNWAQESYLINDVNSPIYDFYIEM